MVFDHCKISPKSSDNKSESILVFLETFPHNANLICLPDFSLFGLIESAKKLKPSEVCENTTTNKIPGFCFQILLLLF